MSIDSNEYLVREFKDLILNLKSDLKGEVIVAGLIENDLLLDDWVVSFDGQFARGFSRDLKSVESTIYKYAEVVNIHLTRDGIYDRLPEGVFHSVSDKPTEDGHELAKESKRQRKVESQSRAFFHPLEQELFKVLLHMEQNERSVLFRLIEGRSSALFTKFWKIDETIDQVLVEKMITYLPFASKFTGNFDFTFMLLESIIGEAVSYRILRKRNANEFVFESGNNEGFTLGKASLGWDLVCGDQTVDLTPIVVISVGPIKSFTSDDIFENDRINKFIHYFCSFFLPFDLDYSIVYESFNDVGFRLQEDGEKAIIGFNTYL